MTVASTILKIAAYEGIKKGVAAVSNEVNEIAYAKKLKAAQEAKAAQDLKNIKETAKAVEMSRHPDASVRGPHDISFHGGLSANQGISMLASSKDNEARCLFQNAATLRTKGLHHKASEVESEAHRVKREADNYHKQYAESVKRAEQDKKRRLAEAEAQALRDKARREAKAAEQARIKERRIAEEKAKASKQR